MKQTIWKKNLILILLTILLCVLPLYLRKDAEFSGADAEAMEAIHAVHPTYQSWIEPLLEPKSSEIESFLFAVQAALGAGVVGFALGRVTKQQGKQETESKTEI